MASVELNNVDKLYNLVSFDGRKSAVHLKIPAGLIPEHNLDLGRMATILGLSGIEVLGIEAQSSELKKPLGEELQLGWYGLNADHDPLCRSGVAITPWDPFSGRDPKISISIKGCQRILDGLNRGRSPEDSFTMANVLDRVFLNGLVAVCLPNIGELFASFFGLVPTQDRQNLREIFVNCSKVACLIRHKPTIN